MPLWQGLSSVLQAHCNLHKPMGTEGYLAGYLLGQWVTLFWFLAKICVEFPSHMRWNPNFIRSMRQFWELVGIGFLFNFGIWADKFMFWLAPDARMILNPFRTNDIYEGPVYFAYLTIVPATAIFLLKVKQPFICTTGSIMPRSSARDRFMPFSRKKPAWSRP